MKNTRLTYMNTPYDETNPSGDNGPSYSQPEPPTGPIIYPEPPEVHIYQGNQAFATASLTFGILALISMCCFPPLAIFLGALGLIFGLMSKGTYARPGNAKAGMILSSIGLAIVTGIVVFAFSSLLSTESGRAFLQDYVRIITNPEEYTQQDIYEILERYLYQNNKSSNTDYDQGTAPGGSEYDDLDEYDENGLPPVSPQPDGDNEFL